MTQHDLIVSALASGLAPREVAERYNLSRQEVYKINWRQRKKECGEYKSKWLTNKKKIKAAYWWGEGELSIGEIAQKLDVRFAQIEEFLQEQGFLDA